jgi:signal transduction histidine kinase
VDKFEMSFEKRQHLNTEMLVMLLNELKMHRQLLLLILGKTNSEDAKNALDAMSQMIKDNDEQIRAWIYETYGPDLGSVSG